VTHATRPKDLARTAFAAAAEDRGPPAQRVGAQL